MAQELLTVKLQLKSGPQILSQDLDRIDDQVRILDQEYHKEEESFASTLAGRLGETDERQARHKAVTS